MEDHHDVEGQSVRIPCRITRYGKKVQLDWFPPFLQLQEPSSCSYDPRQPSCGLSSIL
jgi:hypothetical protein